MFPKESERTLDFFRRQRSQALHTRLRMPPSSGDEGSKGGVMALAPISVDAVEDHDSERHDRGRTTKSMFSYTTIRTDRRFGSRPARYNRYN